MDPQAMQKSAFGRLFIKIVAAGMESRFRYRFFAPAHILAGADLLPGQTVLELGCGTGFFTLPLARLIGEQGSLIAMDVLPESVELVAAKVEHSNLKNVRVVVGNALQTRLDPGSIDTVFLFGVIPAPMLPMRDLLTELHRILRTGGTLAVWPPVPTWLPESVLEGGFFELCSRRNGVHNFRRC